MPNTNTGEKERWRDVKSHEGKYKVSTLGRIMSIKKGKKTIISTMKGTSTHRVVAQTFLPNPKNLPCVDHINRNRNDNRLANLRWCTHSQNMGNSMYSRCTASGYKGVMKVNNATTWNMVITVDDKRIYKCGFRTAEDAALAYNEMAKKIFGEFALLNVIGERRFNPPVAPKDPEIGELVKWKCYPYQARRFIANGIVTRILQSTFRGKVKRPAVQVKPVGKYTEFFPNRKTTVIGIDNLLPSLNQTQEKQ